MTLAPFIVSIIGLSSTLIVLVNEGHYAQSATLIASIGLFYLSILQLLRR